MTPSTADYYGILGLTPEASLADVKKAYRKLARQYHPDRNNADPRAIDRFRRITEAYDYLSAHLKDDADGDRHSRPGPAAPPRADVGMPGEYSQAASRVLTLLEEAWPALRARQHGIPPVVIIITTGREARWDRFDSQRWTVHTTGTLTRILLIQTTPVTHIRGSYGVRRPLSHVGASRDPWMSASSRVLVAAVSRRSALTALLDRLDPPTAEDDVCVVAVRVRP